MNNADTPNYHETRILDAALKAVEQTTGLIGHIGPQQPHTGGACRPDAIVAFKYEGRKYRYAAEIKAVDRIVTLNLLKNRHADCGLPVLLAAPYITTVLAEYCRQTGLQFIDTAGNACLKAKGLQIYVTGQKRPPEAAPRAAARVTTGAGLRVMFALLCKPALLNAPYRDIAKAAGVALGTVGQVFLGLQKRGLLLGDGERTPRRFVDKERLIEEWVLNYPLRLRPKLWAQRFRAPQAGWWKNVNLDKYGAFWGGEIAGDLLTNYRPPGEALVYMPGDPQKMIMDNHLRADPEGDVEITEKFWNFQTAVGQKQAAPPLLVYADLMAAPDPRDRELAKLIYERYIADADA